MAWWSLTAIGPSIFARISIRHGGTPHIRHTTKENCDNTRTEIIFFSTKKEKKIEKFRVANLDQETVVSLRKIWNQFEDSGSDARSMYPKSEF